MILAPECTESQAERLAQKPYDVPGKIEAARLALHHGKVRAAYWKRNAEDVIRARPLRMMALAATLGLAAGLIYHHRPHVKEVYEPCD